MNIKIFNHLKNSSFLSGVSIYFISNIINSLIPFAMLPILTRYLNPSEYGKIAMFQVFVGALGAFVGVNVAGAAVRKNYDCKDALPVMRQFIASCLQILLVSTLIIFLVVWFFKWKLYSFFDINPNWLMLAVLVAASNVVIGIRLSQWQATKNPINFAVLQITRTAFGMILSVLLVVVFLQGSDGYIEAQIWVAIIFSFISLWLLKRDRLLSFFLWNPVFIREAINFGVPLVPHVVGMFLLVSVDRFIINELLGLERAGVYMVALQISMSFKLLFDSVNKAYVPWLFERLKCDLLEKKKSIVRYTYIWYLLIIFGVSVTFWIGPWFIDLIAGKEYEEAGSLIGFLALGQGFGGMYLMVTNYIFYSKRTGFLSFITIFSGLFSIILLYVLVPILGLEGAAISFVAAMSIRFFLTWWVAQKRHPMPWLNFSN